MVQKFDLSDKETSDIKKVATQVNINEQLKQIKEEEEALDVEEFEEDLELTELDKRLNRDIFEDVVNKTIKNGGMVTWTLYKNGEVVMSSARHTYSWAQVHQRFGSGNYQIRPRNLTTGKWMPSQTLALGEYDGETKETQNSSQNSTQSAANMDSLLEHQRKMQEIETQNRKIEREEQEKRQIEQDDRIKSLFTQKEGESNQMFSMFTLMMNQQREDQRLRDEEYRRKEDQRRADERHAETFRREDQLRADDLRREEQVKSEARFEKLLLSLGDKKDDSISAIAHFEKIKKAEKDARAEARQELKDIEERAEKRALEIAAQAGGDDKSITDKAVDAALSSLPSMAQFFANKANPKAETSFKEKTPVTVEKPQRIANPRTINAEVVTPSTSFAGMKQEPQAKQARPQKPKISDEKKREILMKAIEDIISPIILASLMNEEGYIECFSKSTDELTKRKINIKLVTRFYTNESLVDLFAKNGLIEIAESQNKKDELMSWINGYYEEFSKA